ncbi:MAG: DUF3108 domain-containing protein [Pseudomonadota bacterium]|nr:DUF3108 domain-containing protein [Pseudomonadota bacterium]
MAACDMKGRLGKWLIAAGAALCVLTAVPADRPAIADQGFSKLSAAYKVRFAGLPLGTFEVWTNLSRSSYSMLGRGDFTFLLSVLFELKGTTQSSGSISPQGVNPSAFSFNFKTKKQSGWLDMKFAEGRVTKVASEPVMTHHEESIPVTVQDVTGVLDPLSALFLSSRSKTDDIDGSVCTQRIPVYDGKYRFDLVLSHKQTVRVVREKNAGYDGPAVVCRVKYVPVSGHRPDNSTVEFMANNDDIEIWLIPLHHERLYAPYHLVMPTPYGEATATSSALQVELAGQKKASLIH